MVNTENPDYQMCVDKKFLVRDSRGYVRPLKWWHGSGGLLDYSNPEAVEWWHAQMDKVLDAGVDGFKTDGTDPYIDEYILTGKCSRPMAVIGCCSVYTFCLACCTVGTLVALVISVMSVGTLRMDMASLSRCHCLPPYLAFPATIPHTRRGAGLQRPAAHLPRLCELLLPGFFLLH